mgnify:CR=1 FL=1
MTAKHKPTAKTRKQRMTKAIKVKTELPKQPVIKAVDGQISVEASEDDYSIEQIHKLLVGVSGHEAFNKLINQAVNSSTGDTPDDKLNSIMPLLLDIAPKDGLEGMLAVQMLATHNMAMEMAGRAMYSEQTVDGVDMNINRSTKLMRTFTTQLETLQKYRNKGKQTIQVQHVTVNDGGQAVVGNVVGGEG